MKQAGFVLMPHNLCFGIVHVMLLNCSQIQIRCVDVIQWCGAWRKELPSTAGKSWTEELAHRSLQGSEPVLPVFSHCLLGHIDWLYSSYASASGYII